MTTNNALEALAGLIDIAKEHEHQSELLKTDNHDFAEANGHMIEWCDKYGSKILESIRAALLDAPETVEGLDEALKREGAALRVSELSYEDIEIFIHAARLFAQSRQSAGDDGHIGYAVLGDAELSTALVTIRELDGRKPEEYFGHRKFIPIYTLPTNKSEPQTAQNYSCPPGWKMVPIEPTDAIIDAIYQAKDSSISAMAIYKAMLEAAPQPPASAVDVEALFIDSVTGKINLDDLHSVAAAGSYDRGWNDCVRALDRRGYFGLTVDKESGE